MFNKTVFSVIDAICRQSFHCSDDCHTRNFRRLIDRVILVLLEPLVLEFTNLYRLCIPETVVVAATAQCYPCVRLWNYSDIIENFCGRFFANLGGVRGGNGI